MKDITFKMAGEFLRTHLSEEFQNALQDWFEQEQYTDNEMHLFNYFVKEQLGLELVMAKLKADITKQGKKEKEISK